MPLNVKFDFSKDELIVGNSSRLPIDPLRTWLLTHHESFMKEHHVKTKRPILVRGKARLTYDWEMALILARSTGLIQSYLHGNYTLQKIASAVTAQFSMLRHPQKLFQCNPDLNYKNQSCVQIIMVGIATAFAVPKRTIMEFLAMDSSNEFNRFFQTYKKALEGDNEKELHKHIRNKTLLAMNALRFTRTVYLPTSELNH